MKKNSPVVICTPSAGTRMVYLMDWIFNERLGVPYYIITPADVKSFREVHFAYGVDLPEALCQMHASGWMSPGFFQEQKPGLTSVNGIPLPFWGSLPPERTPDIFGAIFWSITRAEEYGGAADGHDRFPASGSWAAEHGLCARPWVDEWVEWIADMLALDSPVAGPRLRPSIDIDDAFAFKGRGLRALTGALGDLAYGRWGLMRSRLKWFIGAPDPFDRYEQLDKWLSDIKKNTHVFYLVSPEPGPFDHNLSPSSDALRTVINHWGRESRTGIHPSYAALDQPDRIGQEKKLLEDITGREVTDARFHFLRFRIPESYRALEATGIRADHSMAWPDRTGFRAGTGHAFPWYDLEAERQTDLKILPYVLMDRSLEREAALTGLDPLQIADRTVQVCRKHAIPFSWIWHNSTMGPLEGWEKYAKVRELLVASE